jgi:hypothetical protein
MLLLDQLVICEPAPPSQKSESPAGDGVHAAVSFRVRAMQVILTVGLAALAGGCGQPGPRVASPSPSVTTNGVAGPSTLLVTAQALRDMSAVGGVETALQHTTVLEIEGVTRTLFDALPATPVLSFRSYATFSQWMSSPNTSGDIRAALYDPEAWQFTPPAEQQDPGGYARLFVVAARARGLLPILAPGMDLAKTLAPGSTTNASSYLTAQLPAKMAQALDGGTGYVVVQAQSLERSPPQYLALVQSAVKQIRSQNSQATVLAGISTNPSGGPVSGQQLLDATQLTRALIDGYWLNVPTPGADCPACGPTNAALGLHVLEAKS